MERREHTVKFATHLFTLRSLDWLWSRLQHIDGSFALQNTVCESSPFVHVQRELADMACAPNPPLLEALLWQFELEEANQRLATSLALESILAASALIWWRFELVLNSWPFSLLKLVTCTNSVDAVAITTAFFAEPLCCLDSMMSLKLRKLWGNAAEMAADDQFKDVLRAWGRHANLTNMHIERLLALIKKAGGSVRPFSLERLLADGFLTQFVSEHLSSGGLDPCVQTRSSMVQEGVPLDAEVLRAAKEAESRGGSQAWMCYAQTQARHRPADVAYQDWNRLKAAEFRCLLAEDQERFSRQAQAARLAQAARRDARIPDAGQAPAPPAAEHIWGLQSAGMPLDSDVFMSVVRDMAGVADAEEETIPFNRWGRLSSQRLLMCFRFLLPPKSIGRRIFHV
jgi:hypothetical protein